ncbi:MAG: aminotransferase class V-fold PLP-dependent enzyme, partial [Candidatus Omnitrophota bacterium]
MIYLDYNATAPLDRRVLEQMMPYLTEVYSNPSSIYRFAQRAKKAVEDARSFVAQLISAQPQELVFTSGGTESNNAVIKGIGCTYAQKGRHIITS